MRKFFFLQRYFSATQAKVGVFVIDDAKLSGSDTLQHFAGMDEITTFFFGDFRFGEFWRVPDFDGDVTLLTITQNVASDEVHVSD